MKNTKPALRNERTPESIERKSFEIIDSEVPEPRPFSGRRWAVVRRMIHTTADFELLDLVRFSGGACDAGVEALKRGGRIVTDTQMARMGIPARRTEPLGCEVACLMNDPRAAELAARNKTTRALAAVDLALDDDPPDIWVIGNAPTALIRLVEHVEAGRAAPALVVGMPVGFVNAAESKELLMGLDGVEWVSISGRKGGSALAACVVNQLAEFALGR